MKTLALLLACALCPAAAHAQTEAAAPAATPTLAPLGSFVIPSGLAIGGIPFGGISGLDYDPGTGQYLAVSDDKSEFAPARFYTLGIDLDAKGIEGVDILATHFLRRMDGTLFPISGVDSESIRHSPAGGLIWSSERDEKDRPFIYRATAEGKATGTFAVPDYYLPNADKTRGAYPNVSFEGLTYTPDGSQVVAITENGLRQDGAKATLDAGSPSRMIGFDAKSGRMLWERIYMTDKIPAPPAKPGGHADNGVSEMLALGPDSYLVMERSWSQGVGDDIRIYRVTTAGSTEVTGQEHVDLAKVTPVKKQLVLKLVPGPVGLKFIDNIECMTFGPKVDGHRTLILAADNNFAGEEQTQFIAYTLPDTLN